MPEHLEVRPLVSVIVRTKDRPDLLKRALRSVAAQTYRPLEVVLINDGGRAPDISEAKKILEDVELNFLNLEKTVGRARAANLALERAKGEFICFLDDDDEYLPAHVYLLVYQYNKNPYEVIYSSCKLIDTLSGGEFVFDYDFSYERLLIENFIPLISIFVSKKALDKIGGFDESFELYEDWDLLIRLAEQFKFCHIKDITCIYYLWDQESQLTLKSRQSGLDQEAYRKLLSKHWKKISPEVLHYYLNLSWLREIRVRNLEKELSLASQKIGELEGVKGELERRISELERKIRSQEEKINSLIQELYAKNAQLFEIHNSLSWKVITKYRKVLEKIVPPHTKRWLFYYYTKQSAAVIAREGLGSFCRKVYHRFWSRRRAIQVGMFKDKTLKQEGSLASAWRPYRRPVTIIIPVHNGYQALKNCLESVLAFTDLMFHHLLIIDDASTDPKVREFLKEFWKQNRDKQLQVEFNPENLGFVKTVNRGFRMTETDVIILNSDTIVTRGWVEKLQRAAYSRPRVATVTPFSNHAYHCSVPEPLKYNFLPQGFDLHSFAEFVERISLKHYPEIPFGSGFCLYIRREALEKLGYFREEVFERGYGEETDFCLRAYKQGFRNLLDDTTYIYHLGGVSFEEGKSADEIAQKNEMIARNLAKLRSLHPEYETLLMEAVQKKLRVVVDYLNLRLKSL